MWARQRPKKVFRWYDTHFFGSVALESIWECEFVIVVVRFFCCCCEKKMNRRFFRSHTACMWRMDALNVKYTSVQDVRFCVVLCLFFFVFQKKWQWAIFSKILPYSWKRKSGGEKAMHIAHIGDRGRKAVYRKPKKKKYYEK